MACSLTGLVHYCTPYRHDGTGVNSPNSFGRASTAASGVVIFGRPGDIRLIPKDGELAIYLVGNLAAILDLCAKNYPGAVATGVQITLGAGARNHLVSPLTTEAMSPLFRWFPGREMNLWRSLLDVRFATPDLTTQRDGRYDGSGSIPLIKYLRARSAQH